MRSLFNNIVLFASTVLISSCITPFEPKGVTDIDNMVVIEGDILQNDTTRVIISRSLAIKEENKVNYITKATVWVESDKGVIIPGKEVVRKAKPQYIINTKGIDPANKYKICVRLIGGQRYESSLVPVLQTPQIDSIGFNSNYQGGSVTFYVNTHDPQNKTKFYKWSYAEDWEFHALYMSLFEYDPASNSVKNIPMSKNRYYCWGSALSSAILIMSTENLAQDNVYQKPLVTMGSDDRRISSIYSMELTQLAITRDAYLYWDNIRKNSDKIGGIFAPQPSEIGGNIKSLSNPGERVLGFISAGFITKKRIFAKSEDIGVYVSPKSCESTLVDESNPIPFKSLYESGLDVISYTEARDESYWVPKKCSDCRLFGTKQKPSFWPNDHY